MTKIFQKTNAFVSKKRKQHIAVHALKEKGFAAWLKKQPAFVKAQAKTAGFEAKPEQAAIITNDKGAVWGILCGVHDPVKKFDTAHCLAAVKKHFSKDALKATSFEIKGLSGKDLDPAHIGWGWACYSFDQYKSKTSAPPALLLSDKANGKSVRSYVEAVDGLRDLINIPANDMGPDEIEGTIRTLGEQHKAKVSVIKGAQLEKNYPLVHMVGKASPRAPRLIDLTWGKATDPKVTLVGKGVAFDTGGLDIKPSQYMRYMKKDMGGAAHTIALAKLIMDHKLPVRLRLIVPAVENAVAGEAFRPGDIVKSRKGLFVENTNTDAEGRLILADALTYACEDKPDILIDYATLTGSARAALGPDIPAMFTTKDKTSAGIQKLTEKSEDPVWTMPLWQSYRKYIENSEGDLVNSAGLPGDLIYSALFLQSFVEDGTDWVHLDCYAWEQSGRPGRPKGAADTGLRSIFAYLESRYG